MQRRYFLELGFKGLVAISSQQFRPQKTRATLVSKYSVSGIRFENRQTRSGLDFVLNNREVQVPSFEASAAKCEGVFETLNMITRMLLHKFLNDGVRK